MTLPDAVWSETSTMDDGPATELDPGRAARTVPDPGRARGRTRGGPEPLFARLADRYEIDASPIATPGGDDLGEAVVYRATERATRRTVAIKQYMPGRTPDPRVWDQLRRPDRGLGGRHLLRVLETGTAAGQAFEISEYIPGESLRRLRGALPDANRTEIVRRWVNQLATAIMWLEDRRIVHGDVKTGNVVLREMDPTEPGFREPVLIDIGSAVAEPVPPRYSWACTPIYQPPEWRAGEHPTAAADWWGLGMIVFELVHGENPFEGVIGSHEEMERHFDRDLVDFSVIADPALNRLCRGLLARNPAKRWGRREIGIWVNDPLALPVEDDVAELPELDLAYAFNGILYRSRTAIRRAMTRHWETAVDHFFAAGSDELSRFDEWLRHIGPTAEPAREALAKLFDHPATNDVRLLRLLLAVDPGHTPVYRGRPIIERELGALAAEAADTGAPGNATRVVRELWVFALLPALAQSPGGEGLARVQEQWVRARNEWLSTMRHLNEPQREMLRRYLRGGHGPAIWLLAACANAAQRAVVDERVQRVRRRMTLDRVAVAWFVALADNADSRWVAWCLVPEAESEARTRRELLLAEQERRTTEFLINDVLEWSRRANTPVALGWAAAGTAALAALWALLILLSDVIGWANQSTVDSAWLVSVGALGATFAVEATLAALVGGDYGREVSIHRTMLLAMRPAAERARRNGLAAFGVLLAVLGAVVLVAARMPAAIPVVTTATVLASARRRFRNYRDHREREKEQYQQQLRQRREPSSAMSKEHNASMSEDASMPEAGGSR